MTAVKPTSHRAKAWLVVGRGELDEAESLQQEWLFVLVVIIGGDRSFVSRFSGLLRHLSGPNPS